MSTLKIKTAEELTGDIRDHVDIFEGNFDWEGIEQVITQDRATIHTSLVAVVKGKKKDSKKAKESQDGELIAAIIGYNQALDDTLTIINSIFKE